MKNTRTFAIETQSNMISSDSGLQPEHTLIKHSVPAANTPVREKPQTTFVFSSFLSLSHFPLQRKRTTSSLCTPSCRPGLLSSLRATTTCTAASRATCCWAPSQVSGRHKSQLVTVSNDSLYNSTKETQRAATFGGKTKTKQRATLQNKHKRTDTYIQTANKNKL